VVSECVPLCPWLERRGADTLHDAMKGLGNSVLAEFQYIDPLLVTEALKVLVVEFFTFRLLAWGIAEDRVILEL
jgi:hypothetical protein